MPVEIRVYHDTAKDTLLELQTLAGGLTGPVQYEPKRVSVAAPTEIVETVAQAEARAASVDEPEAPAPAFREFGKAPEGKSRRTKEEIAEDDELATLAEKVGWPEHDLVEAIRADGHSAVRVELQQHLDRKPSGGEQANISASPEDRQDPENPQDAEDEKAEVEAARDPEKPLTVDDLRDAMGAYVSKFEMAAAQEDGPKIFADALGNPPAGESGWKMSLVAAQGQEQLRTAIAAWTKAAKAEKRYGVS